ncbi:MAG: DUF4364 family protein [Clostridiales bacterium]|nr:DUF4364 family protein [Clostridiales bacterium]
MTAEPSTLYKLIILYMLKQVDFSLSTVQITNFILEQQYTNFFQIQQTLSEIEEDGFIRCETVRNMTICRLTPSGDETIRLFESDIADSIKEDIKNYCKKNNLALKDETSIIADYYYNGPKDYIARCCIRENEQYLLDLSISVPSEEEAESICSHWRERSQEAYANLIKLLL